ncbi:hypothetical protein [Algibacter sp. PT7-4]|uniref:hypothetical protein n=1 Tax=Algibacter ulvanivorans TaxID=3400999 RepID=UPI003AABCCA1
MSWRNVIENSIYIVLISIALIVNNKIIVSEFDGTIQAAIEKETTKIENHFLTEIKKLKAKNGASSVIETYPKIDNEITNTKIHNNKPKDSVKKWFISRWFSKNKYKKTNE